jgi:lipopolysaccharide/colanic/teichoic acid biosynthesis glycosyltransferase
VLFRQARLGRAEVPFTLVKLRTMTDATGPDGVLLPDGDRLTPLGRFLRSTSLDELPELWNVLRGEMSLVGPRPLPVTYRHRYTVAERRRHELRPGITGWAQVNGRNALAWDERLALDVWYVDHRSTRLDLQILVRTLLAVVRRGGISAEGEATMAELRPHLAHLVEGSAPPVDAVPTAHAPLPEGGPR